MSAAEKGSKAPAAGSAPLRFRIQILRRVLEGQSVTVVADNVRQARRRALRLSRGETEPREDEEVNEFCDGSPLRGLTVGIVEKLQPVDAGRLP